MNDLDHSSMHIALQEAEKALSEGEIAVGAALFHGDTLLWADHNRREQLHDPTAHAEMVLIREACKTLGTKDLSGFISVCNAESCPMCASALILSGIRDFYYGAEMESFCDPYIRLHEVLERASGDPFIVSGILEEECRAVVQKGRSLHPLNNSMPE